MAFEDTLRIATFRGVEFKVSSREASGGRRISVDDIPRAPNPITEDMGGMGEGMRVDAFLVGDDYMEQAALLSAALSQKGAGRYIDPWLGEQWVHAVRYTRSESRLRTVSFSIYFQAAHDSSVLEVEDQSPVDEIDSASEAASESAEAGAVEKIDAEGPEFKRKGMSEALAELGNLIEPLGVFSDLATEVAAQADRVTSLINQAATLATSPVDLASAVRVAVGGIAGSFSNALGALYAYEAIFGVSRSGSSGSSLSARQADANTDAVFEQARQEAVAGAARAAVRVDWGSREEAVEARDRVIAEIETLLGSADDEAYLALENLQATLVDFVPSLTQDIPYTDTIELGSPIAALTLAFREYGDASREGEIAARNRVPHPGFMPAGVPIEVLRES